MATLIGFSSYVRFLEKGKSSSWCILKEIRLHFSVFSSFKSDISGNILSGLTFSGTQWKRRMHIILLLEFTYRFNLAEL